eukprot:CAMPEP_0198328610 /NCGR_PEP_ID=MMETSP1450-20131203/15583_1 /TAXON_ID=753684 ORGANISM="Madagascaria erythrocladiodes, Strain CCMP3234" /NCGR_SAMPLE_ID=MMETSP1450 /ASSEMBLY_ACC=CAM_ASM_001115 /LENGTH=158 /DNA_ID=CAMNT_0044032755 /DNA_START=19 /DNA_END=495 /DNA_ORIENTATION=-
MSYPAFLLPSGPLPTRATSGPLLARRRPAARVRHTLWRSALDDLPSPAQPGLPESVKERIEGQINQASVVLYMKGVPAAPECGFSYKAAAILQALGASYESHNVLEDGELREGVKMFSAWPTIPQLYVGGEFLGGADIMEEMYHSGELAKVLADAEAI